WVTTSYHYPFPPEKGKPTDKLFVLSDFDPKTGKAGKVQVFASDLNIPIGILPLPDCKSCIVSSCGEIRKYADTDDDGKADKSEVLFSGFDFIDTHGMTNSFTLMPDGWVYACHGFRNESKVKGKDGHEVKMQSGHTFRFRPDGSRIEVYTYGQVNPFGIAVDPFFNLYTADCHTRPITQLVPGAYYESFGKPHDGLGFTPHVTKHEHGSTGLCGLAWYDADQFPKEYLGCMFVGNVVTNRINFDKIEWKGSTPVAKELPDFLVSKDRWFRPVDIKLGPDGALYVADFYNKIIGHYEVDLKHPGRDKDRGRIWRIVWKGKNGEVPEAKFHRADFTLAKNRELFDDLFHPNLTVRFLAGHQLRRRMVEGKDPQDNFLLDKLLERPDQAAAVLGWVASIAEAGKGLIPVRDYKQVVDASKERKTKPEHLTGQLVRALASRPKWDKDERELLLDILKSFDSVHQRRAVVEAMIFHPHADFIKPLIDVLKKCPADDVLLKQAAKIALRNCMREEGGWKTANELVAADVTALKHLVPSVLGVRAKPAAVFLATQFDNDKYKLKRHEAAGMSFEQYLEVVDHIGRYGTHTEFRKVITPDFVGAANRPERLEPVLQTSVRLVRAIQAVGGKSGGTLLDDTRAVIETALGEKADPKHARLAVQLLGALLATPNVDYEYKFLQKHFQKQLAWWMSRTSAPVELRAEAFELAVKYMLDDMLEPIGKVLSDQAAPPALRDRIAPMLAADPKALAHDGIRDGIRDAMKHAPYRVSYLIAFNLAGSKSGTELLLKAVKMNDVSARVLQEKPILEKLRTHGIADLDKQLAALTKGLPPLDQQLAALLKKRTTAFASAKPDKELGAKIFTKHCAACHRIGEQGGKIAPQLDGIGLRGVERLMEDLLDPNRNVDEAFRARSIKTTDDRTITALMLRVEGKVLVLADLEGKEIRLPLKEIVTNRPTMLSAMPANFGETIPEADFYHLLAYLLDQKAKEPPKK
ncbi:MAG: c-type cytochrome, partial [Planctomycetia bacterium]|nr:c-type cytochrome [Planctomycetia bacterium]